jgi:hypothetical protein
MKLAWGLASRAPPAPRLTTPASLRRLKGRQRCRNLESSALGGSSSNSNGRGPFDRGHQQDSMLHALSSPERVGGEYGEVRWLLCPVI